jgi:hypothetical protein
VWTHCFNSFGISTDSKAPETRHVLRLNSLFLPTSYYQTFPILVTFSFQKDKFAVEELPWLSLSSLFTLNLWSKSINLNSLVFLPCVYFLTVSTLHLPGPLSDCKSPPLDLHTARMMFSQGWWCFSSALKPSQIGMSPCKPCFRGPVAQFYTPLFCRSPCSSDRTQATSPLCQILRTPSFPRAFEHIVPFVLSHSLPQISALAC